MTAWLFRDFPYQHRCEARVVNADARGIVLDCTIFYPHGGGQPGDTGTLVREDGTVLPVVDTLKGETRGEIVHVLPAGALAPRAGETVGLVLDWERRYAHMRMHTACHLLSAVLPYPVTGGSIRRDSARLDFDMPASAADKDEIAAKVNALIDAGLEVASQCVRIIAATHQNLDERVRQGLFREDLLHRLNVVRLRLPALRERGEDIAPLARHFLQKSARELAVDPKALAEGALKALATFSFPGNVRQLENICHWLTVMAPGQRVEAADLPPEVREPVNSEGIVADTGWLAALDRELARSLARGERAVGDRLEQEFEKALIRRALAHTAGHRMEAALWLGWGRNTLTRKIQELGMEAELRKGGG